MQVYQRRSFRRRSRVAELTNVPPLSNVEQLGACGASMSVLNIILYNGVDNMFEYVDENPVLRVTIYDKTTTYLNCTIIYWYKVVFLPGII